jgi:hypothetical protein
MFSAAIGQVATKISEIPGALSELVFASPASRELPAADVCERPLRSFAQLSRVE